MSKDSKMYHLADDIQKVQVKTNMYINEYGPSGAFHLAREIVQNNFDECLDKDSPGKTIEVSYDKATDILTSEDDGRGFNEKEFPMSIFCTTLQSGSKFFREGGAASSGEFGVGMTVVNALSDTFLLESYREAENTIHTLTFKEGILTDDITKKRSKSGKSHGTLVKFKTSPKYMGANVKMPVDELVAWIDKLFYLNSDELKKNNITCRFSLYDGLSLEDTKKFKPKPFSDLLDRICDAKKSSSMCSITGHTSFTEDSKVLEEDKNGNNVVKRKKLNKGIHMDIAFRYAPEDITYYDTYCNYTNTIDHGTHKDAFEQAYCRYMLSKVNASMTENQRDKLKVTWDDIKTGLCCVLNLSTDAAVGFVGNAKRAIDCKELLPLMNDIVKDEITKFFDSHDTVLNEYIKIIKLNAKARIEAQKTKNATQTDRLNNFKEHEMKNYVRCNNTGKQWKELFLVEGQSAAGTVRNASDPKTQALFMFRGVTANALKCSLAEIMENHEWKDLVTVLRCGIGNKFDLNKLYFDRINIFTDQDVDGFFISAGMLAFFYTHMRPIIEAGKLYKVYSPLYRIADKEHPFVANKAEMIEIYHDRITKKYKVKLEGSDSYISKGELREFLTDTYEYRDNLIRAAKDSGNINKFLVEVIIAYLVLYGIVDDGTHYKDIKETFNNQKFIKTIMSKIQKDFKEVTVDNNGRFSGVVDGKFAVISVGSRFIKKTTDLIPVYKKYGYKITVCEKGKDEERTMSIGAFLEECMKLMPQITERFKGLGELNANELHKTTLDINNRISIQYTIDDVERELDIFRMTHGNGKKDSERRKKMMREYKIKREDLDN